MSTVQPDPWADISAELHKLADDVLGMVGELAPAQFAIAIQPQPWNSAEAVAAVDTIATLLLGKPGETQKMSGAVYHRNADGFRGSIKLSVFRQMPAPDERDAELDRLRARVAELEARDAHGFSREAEAAQPVAGRLPAHLEDGVTGEVLQVADGHVVHECCGKLDDAPHANFCANYVPAEASRELLAIVPSADGVAFALAPAGAVVDPVARAKVVELTEAVAAGLAQQNGDGDFVRIQENLVSAQVCTSLSDEDATARMNLTPSGTSHGWQLTDDPDNGPVPCADEPDTRRHLVFVC